MTIPAPHDLVWVKNNNSLISQTLLPEWVSSEWSCSLPLVIRRDIAPKEGLIPVGIRGVARHKRAAAWIELNQIVKIVSPEMLVQQIMQQTISLDMSSPALSALACLLQFQWPWDFGITGSCGYSFATQKSYMTDQSDLDLIIRYLEKPTKTQFDDLLILLPQLPCRVDIQLESPNGACALTEWCTKSNVLLKTNSGPLLVADPWNLEESA